MSQLACSLCARLESLNKDPDLILETDSLAFFRGPFWTQWPGAVMAVYKGHKRDLHETRRIPVIQNDLLLAERVVSKCSGASRMNVVKFGNVCEHLHWHLIPRFEHEIEGEKTSWELQGRGAEDLYHRELGVPRVAWEAMVSGFREMFSTSRPAYFSTALFLRPREGEVVSDLEALVCEARERPEQWECLVMRRNYADFGWDTFGGSADPGEFPEQTLRREVFEELGWKVGVCREVSRQWQRGVLRGFSFVALPDDPNLLKLDSPRSASDEVGESRYFGILELRDDPGFPVKIRQRIEAFLDGRPDFELFK